MISSLFINKDVLHYIPQINRNMVKISYLAIPLIASAILSTAQAGLCSYTACIATCPAMAMAAPPGLFQYTFQACMASCTWMLSPACP